MTQPPLEILRFDEKNLNNLDETRYFLKKMKISLGATSVSPSNGLRLETVKEIGILRTLQSPHVINLKGLAIYDKGKPNGKDGDEKQSESNNKDTFLYMLFPRMVTNLRDYFCHIYSNKMLGVITPDVVRSYAAQLLLALEHCHQRGIVHRNVTPDNILVANDGLIKLGGFGSARYLMGLARPLSQDEWKVNRPDVAWYLAPESLLNCPSCSTQVDIWSAGLIITEMFNEGKILLPGTTEVEQLMYIFRLRGTPTESQWPGVTGLANFRSVAIKWPGEPLRKQLSSHFVDFNILQLLEILLKVSPYLRCTATAALAHDYFLKANLEKKGDTREQSPTLDKLTSSPREQEETTAASISEKKRKKQSADTSVTKTKSAERTSEFPAKRRRSPRNKEV